MEGFLLCGLRHEFSRCRAWLKAKLQTSQMYGFSPVCKRLHGFFSCMDPWIVLEIHCLWKSQKRENTFEKIIAQVGTYIIPLAAITTECPNAHNTMQTFVNTSRVLPWHTNEYDSKPITCMAFCNTRNCTAFDWMVTCFHALSSCTYCHVTTCICLSTTSPTTSTETCCSGSCIPSICHCSIHLLTTLTLLKFPTILLDFPSIMMMLAATFHTTIIKTFLMAICLFWQAVLNMHAFLVALKLTSVM